MNSTQIKILLGLIAAVALCWLSAPYWGAESVGALVAAPGPVRFDAARAFQTTEEFVTRNPKRVLGSLESRQATGYLQETLHRLGYEVSFTHFDAVIVGRSQAGRNVLGFRRGPVPGILVIEAHYDTARTTVQGATDDGAGVGSMLELARVFAESPLRHSLLLVASDGEEWGMLGAADIAANFPQRQQIAAVLSLDGLSPGDLAGLELNTEGQLRGYTPSWLRRIARSAAEAQGLPVASPSGFREMIQRALELSRSDQGPFLALGIPAINLGSVPADPAAAREIYHSANDTVANLRAASLATYGAAAERIVRSIDELDPAPAGSMGALRWKDAVFISGSAMGMLLGLTFLPFLAATVFSWKQHRESLRADTGLREAAFFIAWMAPFALAFSLVQFSRLLRLIPQYSMYPGPFRDPVLLNPAWVLMAVIAAVSIGAGIGLHFLVRYLTRGIQRSSCSSNLALQALLLILVVIAFLFNNYAAVAFLALPALIWSTVGGGKGRTARIAGAAAIAAAGCVSYVVAIQTARSLNAGWDIFWYATLGLSTGILSWQGFFLGASAVVLGLRFLSLQFIR